MPLSQGRINDMALGIRCDENVLDHAVSAQQVDAIQKQLGIGGYALTDGSRHVEPHSLIAALQCAVIGLEQPHETLNQQCEIERIGGARAKNDAMVVDTARRPSCSSNESVRSDARPAFEHGPSGFRARPLPEASL